MKRRNADLLVVIVLMIVGAFVVLNQPRLLWARVPLGILMTLAPGFLLADVLFPGTSVSVGERAALGIGFGLALAALGGIFLYLVGENLDTNTWVFFIGAETILGSGVVFLRRRRYQKAALEGADLSERTTSAQRKKESSPSLVRWLPFGLALILIVSSILFARSIAQALPHTDVIQLWMIPDPADPVHDVQLGVITKTADPHHFSVLLRRGGTLIQQWPTVSMQPEDRWQTTLTLPAHLPGSGPLEADLIDQNDPSKIIRQVSLWPEPQ